MRAEEVTGVILAGGLSTRMGSDKALLPVAGKPLIRHLAEGMLALGIRRIVVACGTEERGRDYGNRLQGLHQGLTGEIAFAADRYPGCGPLAGLHAALSAMPEGGYAFVMACDMPMVSAALFDRLRQAVTGTEALLDPTPQAVLTPNQPFHALYHASALGELEPRLERSDLRVMSLLGALRTIRVAISEEDEASAFINLNTPELYEQFARRSE
ncbi:molybdenum cofactor guanylyltransferase [Paenibacillus rhizovicinus]|uniref:Probable molybdenum cofactor guanylyltransferase n=1 Tax=Paenibacillus rhizovicinus TaxID=2704463 RepID=A0A6C0P7G9_9BACL|nr:molybdenum cofactor guanylyltransferase [Paenibacillus rhizovicinus]QHW32472.1 molybdenum cofactor guanylyltransferase [Paenibacillus rhizovicinus]